MLDRFDNISHAQERKLRLTESNMNVYQTHAKKNANLAAALEGMSYLPPGDARPSRDYVEGLPSPDCEIEVVLRNAHSLGSEELKAAEHAFKTDRKSTRLNSSHLVISYAVFCLKKKR